jgi:hypothetical protein
MNTKEWYDLFLPEIRAALLLSILKGKASFTENGISDTRSKRMSSGDTTVRFGEKIAWN